MIKTEVGANVDFIRTINGAREEFAKGERWDKEQSWGAKMIVDPRMVEDPNYLFYMIRRLLEYEKDMIYKAVVYSGDEWTAIRSRFLSYDKPDFLMGGLEYAVRVDAVVSDRKIYVPIFEKAQMPPDVYKCTWCGGYTKNDKRGHCSGCGGPRNDRYLEDR